MRLVDTAVIEITIKSGSFIGESPRLVDAFYIVEY